MDLNTILMGRDFPTLIIRPPLALGMAADNHLPGLILTMVNHPPGPITINHPPGLILIMVNTRRRRPHHHRQTLAILYLILAMGHHHIIRLIRRLDLMTRRYSASQVVQPIHLTLLPATQVSALQSAILASALQSAILASAYRAGCRQQCHQRKRAMPESSSSR